MTMREKAIEEIMQSLVEQPLNVDRAADYLGVTTGAMYDMVHAKKVSCYKPSLKCLYFKKADLDAYAFRNRKASNFELSEKADELLNANQKN